MESYTEGFAKGFTESFAEYFVKDFAASFTRRVTLRLQNELTESEAIGISKGIARCIRALMHTMNISQGDAINLLCVPEDDIPEVLEQLRPLS